MSNTFKKIWNIVAWLLVGLVVALAILLAGVRVMGLQVFSVLSGSMEPEYMTGSLIYVKKVDTDTLEVNDVITFMLSSETVATHRIVGMVPSEDEPGLVRYRTKGDMNQEEDGTLVHPSNVVGTPVFTIPYLGYLASFIQNPPGTYIAISIGAILILIVFLPDLLDCEDGEKKNSKKSQIAPHPAKKNKQPGTPLPRPVAPTQTKALAVANLSPNKQASTPQRKKITDEDLMRLTPQQIERLRQKLPPEKMEVLLARIARAKKMEMQLRSVQADQYDFRE